MHELTLCRNIVDIAVSNVSGNRKIKKINLEVGKLALIDKQALLFSFDLVAQKTLAADATLSIIEIESKARCNVCHCVFALLQRYDACPRCNGHSLSILLGEELRIKSMEVEGCVESADAMKEN